MPRVVAYMTILRILRPKKQEFFPIRKKLYENAVNPDIAVRLFPGTQIPFIGVGDSIVRANFVWGNGLAINGIIMLFYTLFFGGFGGDCCRR